MSAPAGGGATSRWRTVELLLTFARRRSCARVERRGRLQHERSGTTTDWTAIGAFFQWVLIVALQVCSAILLLAAIAESRRVDAASGGGILVSPRCHAELERLEREGAPASIETFRGEGRWAGVDDEVRYEVRLLHHYKRDGRALFVTAPGGWGFARQAGPLGPLAALLGSLVVLGWFAMLAFQGEGVDLDLQRRRHPMWEWLLSHPVDPRAVFLSEMLSPLAANPSFWFAPVFWIGAYWIAYEDLFVGLLGGLAAGIPLCIAAGCVGKTMEIVALLRLSPRNRGAALGLLSWLGQAILMSMVFAAFTPAVPRAVAQFLGRVAEGASLPFLGWALGLSGTPSPWKGVLACWGVAAVLTLLAAQLSASATRRGLAGAFGGSPDAPWGLAEARPNRFLRDPIYRKELLWLWRDRGALIQVFLIPLSLAAFQLFNLRHLLARATGAWHLMAGAAVVFGSYFLHVLGPRSLVSEGAALWLPLTWPRGLEQLLKAKARLYWLISLAVVGPLLMITALRFPLDAWKVAVVAILWAAFGRSVAEKGVTLVNAPSSSGEPEPVPQGRRWAASLGTLTFGIGILSQQWHLAFMGVVYSWLTSAAMWQNLRARLPYLFDPWSERVPTAPTLMHAMIAISAMTEVVAVVAAMLLAFSSFMGNEGSFSARSIAYGLCAIGTWAVMNHWLAGRGVDAHEVWCWDAHASRRRTVAGMSVGLVLGLALGAGAVGYSALLERIPEWGEGLRLAREHLASHAGERGWLALMAVGFAPFAEEYLFRGLLFRALDREWGGLKAVLGSACFFAVYHPPQSWIPVGLLGVVSAVLFKRTGHLLPSVLLHLVYNAIVVWTA